MHLIDGDGASQQEPAPRFLIERRNRILQQVLDEGRVDVSALADAFQVTTETIRRDLVALEQDRLVQRVHGGAVPWHNRGFEPLLDVRLSQHADEKRRIAHAALAELPDRGTVIIDSGSTTALLADALDRERDLTVITNSIPVLTTLAATPKPDVILLGGALRRDTMALVDETGVEALDGMTADVLFLSCDGVSPERGFTTPYRHEAAIKGAMLASARRVVMVFDHSKVGHDHLFRFATFDDVDVIVTGTELDAATAHLLEAEGPEVRRG